MTIYLNVLLCLIMQINTIKGIKNICDNGFTNNSAELLDPQHRIVEKQVVICRRFINTFLEPATVFSRTNSYAWKHYVEKMSGEYISNGAFIMAAALEGIEILDYDLNAVFKFKRTQPYRKLHTYVHKKQCLNINEMYNSTRYIIPDYWPYKTKEELLKVFQ